MKSMIKLCVLVTTMALAAASSKADPPGLQDEDFYWNDGTKVIDGGFFGMPFAHAVILRFYDRPQADGINWDLMTVKLTPRSA